MILYIISFLFILSTYLASRTISEVVDPGFEFLRFKVWYIPVAIFIILLPILNIIISAIWAMAYFMFLILSTGYGDVKIKESFKKGFWNRRL